MSELLQGAVRNNFWSVLSTAGAALIGVVTSATTIRLLGVADAGFVTASLTLVGIYLTLGNFGLPSALVREISSTDKTSPRDTRSSIDAALGAATLAGLFGGLVFAVGAPLIVSWSDYTGSRSAATLFCVLSGIAILLTQWGNILIAVVDGAQRQDIRGKIILGIAIPQCIATIAGLVIQPSLITLGWINLVGASSRTIALHVAGHRLLGFRPSPKWTPSDLRRHWTFARWIYARALANLFLQGGDRVVLVSMFGSATLPFYSLARRFYEFGHELLTAPGNYLFPLLSSAGTDARAMTKKLDDRLRWFIAAASAWAYSIMLSFAPLVLELLVGADFAWRARPAIVIFAIVGFAHAQSIFPFYSAMAGGRPQRTFWFQLACGIGAMTAIFVLGQIGDFFLSAAGQLWVALPVAVLLWTELTPTGHETRWRALLSPFAIPTLLIAIGGALHLLWWLGLVDTWALALTGALWAALFFPLLCRIERLLDRSSARVETLHRALLIVSSRVGVGPSAATWISGASETALPRAPS